MQKPTLGVFGLGQFMEFFIPHLQPYFGIKVYDKDSGNNEKRNACLRSLQVLGVDMRETAQCDFVMLGYPAKYISNLCQDISPYIQADTVVFDICCVKNPVVCAMLEYLPKDCHILATHPIFGPQSGKHGVEGLKCTLSQVRCSDEKYSFLKNVFGKKMGLKIFEMSPEEHDREMAYIQGITHFIGRSLKKMNIPKAQLSTVSYERLREASEMVGSDSDELFLSIQNDNPYVKETREALLQEFKTQDNFVKNNVK